MENEIEAYVVENHPQDSRVKIKEDNVFQALAAQMGLGGGNIPLVMIRRKASGSENSKE